MHSKILGSLLMLWGVGAFLGIIETILLKNYSTGRLLVICLVQLIICIIPIILGYKIFRRKEYSKSNYTTWIIIILLINLGFSFYYKDKLSLKIAMFKLAVHHITTPKIIEATIKNDVKEINQLIVKGADVNKKDSDGRTAIFYAHNVEIMKILLDAGADVNLISNVGHTLLNSKAGSTNIQSYEATKMLLEHGLTKETINSQKGYWGYNALHRSDICMLCDESKEYTDGYKNVELLIKNGANVNSVNKKGETPIFTVNDKCKRILINNGADIFATNNNNENVLFYIKDFQLFSEITKKGLDYTVINAKNETILHHTFSAEIANLVTQKVDINHKNHEGRTALFWCYYSPDKFKVLLRNNADVNIPNNEGETVLHQYARECRSDKNEYQRNLFKIVEMILETDIDVNHKDNKGKTALDYVRFDKVKKLLTSKGARNS
nr:ankyrin repeat domain-containing protein [uncultured Desulfobulbus sp.]